MLAFVIVTVPVPVQVKPSVAVTVNVPGVKPVAIAVVCEPAAPSQR
ncbi:MAG: hypothetical protein JKY53_10660 [Flavobacteriales bacterium]|nr:hypothetical protein [Flavobacteriales bacterium]